MERTVDKRVAAALAFIIAIAVALAMAPQAHAATQEADDNTSSENAAILASGKTASGQFYHAEGTPPSTIEDYWYKFKTSNRTSAYALKLESVDRHMIFVTCFDSDMNEFDWGSADGSVVDSTSDYLIDLPKEQWIYFRFSCSKTYLDYNKRFKITVTEYNPIFKYVTGLKASKKTGDSLTMKWKAQLGVARYEVQYKPAGGKWKTKTVAKNSVKLTGLAKKTQYRVRVRACASEGKGYYLDERAPAKHTDWTRAVKVRTAKK